VPVRAVLLDLDETLIHERASTQAALWATCADACAARGLDPQAVGAAVLAAGRELWQRGPHFAYCRRIGISSWEGLWATFAVGDDPDTVGLRAWAPVYRRQAWRRGLRAAGLDDPDLAAELAERFVWERARRQVLFPEALGVLVALRAAGLKLALVTNGDRDLQRRKAVGSGVVPLVDHVVISGELGVGKPEPGIFAHALRLLGVGPAEAVMVGDSRERDVAGGAAAGLRTVWLDRFGEGATGGAGGPVGSGTAASLEEGLYGSAEGLRPWAVLPDLRGLPALLGLPDRVPPRDAGS
jgi:putative hydrolase of the HAD superfamily